MVSIDVCEKVSYSRELNADIEFTRWNDNFCIDNVLKTSWILAVILTIIILITQFLTKILHVTPIELVFPGPAHYTTANTKLGFLCPILQKTSKENYLFRANLQEGGGL